MTASAFERVKELADAVMYEGYVLYPYRASAMKNRFRWQFGVVAPQAYAASGGDPWYAQTECLVEGSELASVTVNVRCLHVQRRTVEEPIAGGGWRPCERLVADGREWLTWDEAVPAVLAPPRLAVAELCARGHTMPFQLPIAHAREVVADAHGRVVARLVRERRLVSGEVRIGAERAGRFVKVRVRVENTTCFEARERDAALSQSLIGCHTLLHVEGGEFISLIDPPADAAAAARSCVNAHTWPVLAGDPGDRDLMLSAPIILSDYPAVAPESRDRFFDGTEMDEMLALRVLTMTDEEKREAAATDGHAGAIVGRRADPADGRLHGAIRSFEELLNTDGPSPGAESVELASVRIAAGSRVRLVPRGRGDAIDMFLAGRVATVAAVHRDLENRVYLAVTIDGDPGADLRRAYGRFFYFSPDDVRPLDAETHDAARG